MQWRRWAVPLGLYVLALGLRLALVAARPYGDEAHHYFVAREFGQAPDNYVHGPDVRWLFWWRPLFSLLLVPGAQVSFTAFRVEYMLLVSLLAPLAWWVLRQRGVRSGFAAGAALVLAGHPFFVVWGVRAFPDELMATFYLLALALWQERRYVLSLAAWLAALWIKEVALVGFLLLCAEEAWLAWRHRTGLRPKLAPRHAGAAAVLALAWLPHLVANALGGRNPGWSRGGDLAMLLDGVFLTAWFVPAVAAALLPGASRRLAVHALGYLAFFGLYEVRGGASEAWYFVLPSALAVLAMAGLLDAWWQWASGRVAGGPARRHAARSLPVALVLAIVAGQALLPAASATKQDLHPLAPRFDPGFQDMVRIERTRDQDLWTLMAATRADDWTGPLVVDVGWFFVLWPLSDRAQQLASAYTADNGYTAQDWSFVMEDLASMVLLRREPTPLNEAIRATYADCVSVETAEYLAIQADECRGRADALDVAWRERR